MDIDFLRDFTVIAQQENMTLAADILNISPSALSNNLHKLEAELGCQLFTRTSKGIRLNDSGRYFLEWVRKNGDFQEKTLKKLEDSTKIRGTLKIGAAVETDTLFIFLAAFQKRYPEIRLEVYSGKPTQEQLLLTDLDAFVLPEQDKTLPGVLLGRRNALYVLMRRDHLLAQRKSLSLENLREEPFVFCANDSKVDWIYDYCRDHGFQPKVQILCENLNRSIDVIANSHILALGYNTMRMLRESIRDITAVPLETDETIEQHLFLAWREQPLNPLANLLSEFAREFDEQGRDAFI